MALSKGEVPVGCVVVHKPTARIISCGHNETSEAFNVRIVPHTIGCVLSPRVGHPLTSYPLYMPDCFCMMARYVFHGKNDTGTSWLAFVNTLIPTIPVSVA